MSDKKKAGRPKSYEDKTTISHAMESSLLTRLNLFADLNNTRTSLINQAVEEFLTRRKG